MKPGSWATSVRAPVTGSTTTSSRVPTRAPRAAACQRGECGIDSPRATTSPDGTSMTHRRRPCSRASRRRVGRAQHGHVLAASSVDHRQAVQVAAVLGRERADERRPPARHEAVRVVERGQAGEARVDDPQLAARVRQFVHADVAGEWCGCAARTRRRADRGGSRRVRQRRLVLENSMTSRCVPMARSRPLHATPIGARQRRKCVLSASPSARTRIDPPGSDRWSRTASRRAALSSCGNPCGVSRTAPRTVRSAAALRERERDGRRRRRAGRRSAESSCAPDGRAVASPNSRARERRDGATSRSRAAPARRRCVATCRGWASQRVARVRQRLGERASQSMPTNAHRRSISSSRRRPG